MSVGIDDFLDRKKFYEAYPYDNSLYMRRRGQLNSREADKHLANMILDIIEALKFKGFQVIKHQNLFYLTFNFKE